MTIPSLSPGPRPCATAGCVSWTIPAASRQPASTPVPRWPIRPPISSCARMRSVTYPPRFHCQLRGGHARAEHHLRRRADAHRCAAGARGFQRAVAAAQNSRLGNGGAPHRTAPRSGPVAHGHHAAFDRAFFDRLGGYDAHFSHNEDAEFDYRALRAGGRIWMCAEARVEYYPRDRPMALLHQYIRNGRGRARTLLLHRPAPQCPPDGAGPAAALPGGLAAFWRRCGTALRSPPLAYAALCLAAGPGHGPARAGFMATSPPGRLPSSCMPASPGAISGNSGRAGTARPAASRRMRTRPARRENPHVQRPDLSSRKRRAARNRAPMNSSVNSRASATNSAC